MPPARNFRSAAAVEGRWLLGVRRFFPVEMTTTGLKPAEAMIRPAIRSPADFPLDDQTSCPYSIEQQIRIDSHA